MKEFLKGGSEYIKSLIQKSVVDGSYTATVTGNYEIETVVKIPSEFTLVLDGCHLKMADGVFSNMFTNKNHKTGDKNIKILGKNGATLDGGNYNGLSEKTQNTGNFPDIWNNNLIILVNVDGFEDVNKKIGVGMKAVQLTATTLNGYTFEGWYLDEDLTVPFERKISSETRGDINLYAKISVAYYTDFYE